MIRKITFKPKLKGALTALLSGVAMLFSGGSLQAQTYCAASNSWGCAAGNVGAGDLSAVTITNAAGKTLASWTGSCSGGVQIANAGNAFDVTAGEKLTVNVKGTTDNNGWGWGSDVGVWLDNNRDGSFATNENLADPQTGPYQSVGPAGTTSVLTVPCFSSTGAARMRFRSGADVYTLLASNGCGTAQTYGTILDFEVTLKLGAPPIANFIVPTGPNYEKTPVLFNSTNQSAAYLQTWKFTSGTPAAATGAKATSVWSTPGTYNVELKQDYCGIKDSITKTVTIVAPTSVPVADFVAKYNKVEQYFDAELFDLSSNGAYIWSWEITDPLANVYNYTVKNPKHFMDEIGKYDVCLTSENGLGAGTKVCKTAYLEGTPATEYYLGPQKLGESSNGTLYDAGGPNGNYGNNYSVATNYFKILPCGAKEIKLSFTDLDLADATDIIRIYDADQEDPTKLLTPVGGIDGTNDNIWKDSVFIARSGAMYITFQTGASGTARGFIAKWESALNPPTAPNVDFTFPYNPASNGVMVDFTGVVSNAQGESQYEWTSDASYLGNKVDYSGIFPTDGTYNICLDVTTCSGNAIKCKDITIVTPTAPGVLDYVADQVRPKVLSSVKFKTSTDYANNFKWSIFPLTYEFVDGTTDASQNPVISFKQGGAYTFTLSAWNAAGGKASTEKKVIKNKYVVVLDPCTPLVNILSGDVGISSVNLKDGSTVLINNETDAGIDAYTDYTTSVSATLNYGKSYDLSVSRVTNSNPVNYKVWIDYNIDGTFDASELVLNSGSINTLMANATFTVPKRSLIFEGKTRMRVGSAYSNFSNTPCGVNQVGEFEDYEIVLANDGTIPVITLVGNDTISVEKGSSSNSCWDEVASTTFNATDNTTGDLNSEIQTTSDLDCTLPGIYTICLNVEDASGNKATTKCRTVYVVLDRTAPTLTINAANPLTVAQCDAFTQPTAVANDLVDGNLSSAVIVTGSVDANKVGDYVLTYTVQDAQGNKTVKTLDVQVRDNAAPSIKLKTVPIVNNSTVKIQILGTFVDEVYTEDGCNGIIATVKTPGFAGPVDASKKGIYPVKYESVDASGNLATENAFTINYSVDDYIAPEIDLKTSDTIIHDVNTVYNSAKAVASDNYYPTSKISLIKSGIVDAYNLGDYSELYTATDESGNASTRTRTVRVVDRIAPIIIVNPINACVGSAFNALSGITLEDNYYGPSVLQPLVEIVDHNINTLEAGVYYVNYRVTDPSGNKSLITSRNVFVTYPPNCQNTFLSNAEISLSESVSVYPNPAVNGKFDVGYNVANNGDVKVVVSDMSGRTVYKDVASNGGFGKMTIDLSGKSSGVYNVTITNAGSSTTKKVVLK